MEFVKEVSLKGVYVPVGALKLSKLSHDEPMEMHTLDHVLVLMKKQMTAPELLDAAHSLADAASELLNHLAEVCGPCGDCGKDGCPYDYQGGESVELAAFLRQEAGIPEDVKLCAEVNQETHSVTISEAGYRYDLRDLPDELLATFAEAGTCLGRLEEHLIMEDTVYGK